MSTTMEEREHRKQEGRRRRDAAYWALARPRRAEGGAVTLDDGWTLDRGIWTGPNGERVGAISGGYDGGASIYIMTALTVAAAAASAYAQYSASEAQSAAMKYNAQESERQAEIADQQARFAAQQQAEADRRTRAKARAIMGTSGVDVSEGSSLLVDLDSAKQAELNYQSIRYQGEARARALSSQATLDRFQARSTQRQGLIGAGVTLLGGAADAASSYQKVRTSTPKSITVPDTSPGSRQPGYGYM